MKKINSMRIVIVEDHYHERKELEYLLSLHPNVEVIGAFEDTASAWPLIAAGNIDGVFLDIEIPAESERAGLDLAIRIDRLPIPKPWIIFTTIMEKYAREAHDVRPFGYLDKPLDNAKVERVLNKVGKIVQLPANSFPVIWIEKDRHDEPIKHERYITQDEIVFVESIKGTNTVKVQLGQGSALSKIHIPLKEWEENSDLPDLMRIHRSRLVNVSYVDGIKNDPCKEEGHCATIRGSALVLAVSNHYLNDLRNAIRSCTKRFSIGNN